MELVIRFDYGSIVPWVRTLDGTLLAIAGPDAVLLRTPVEHEGRDLRTVASFTVAEGDRVPFVLRWFPSNETPPEPIKPEEALVDTVAFWEDWASRCTYEGRWHDAVHRSLLTLKALTFAPTGGIVAAPTTSLPEWIGGVRNWDYRYCWLRDATLTLLALVRAGYVDEAGARWRPPDRVQRDWRRRRRWRQHDVGQPHGDAVDGQLVGERQPDGSRTGAEIGDASAGAAVWPPARSPRRRRPRSRAAGSAPADRPPGRGGESPSGRGRTPTAPRRGDARPSRRDGRPSALRRARRRSPGTRRPPRRRAGLLAQPPSGGVAEALADLAVQLTPLSSSPPASWRDRSSAASAATTSSRSPASTSASR